MNGKKIERNPQPHLRLRGRVDAGPRGPKPAPKPSYLGRNEYPRWLPDCCCRCENYNRLLDECERWPDFYSCPVYRFYITARGDC